MDDFELPPPLRKPGADSQEMAELVLNGIDSNIAWLAERGMHPHPTVIARRAKYVLILEGHSKAIVASTLQGSV